MDEAVRTTASPAAIWAIVIAMSIFTAILVGATAVADSWQARAIRRARRFGMMLPGGAQPGIELSGDPASPDLMDAGAAPVGAGAGPGPGARAEAVPAPRSATGAGGPGGPLATPPDGLPAGRHRRPESEQAADAATLAGAEAPTRPDLPPVPGRHAMPAQRKADIDQAARRRPEER